MEQNNQQQTGERGTAFSSAETAKADIRSYIESAGYIKERVGVLPEIAVILGSGLGAFAETGKDRVIIPYSDIPNFPVSTVSYQKGELICATVGDKRVLMMNGRFHYYEGYEFWQTAYPIGVFKLLGIKKIIITNAAGGISEDYRIGDLVVIRDHIKFSPASPLRGANIPEFGDRFCDMQSVYDRASASLALNKAEQLGMTLHDNGIYAYMAGPQYETPAEIRMLRAVGATLVGMSTVAEVIAAAHCRIPVLAISAVTNMASGISAAALNEDEVVEVGQKISGQFSELIGAIIREMT